MRIPDSTSYGIVVDSGSSGSRIQIYAWEEPGQVKSSSPDTSVLESPPKIYQKEDWSKKIKGGVSTFGDKPDKVWVDHYKGLMDFAQTVIPELLWQTTPVFVLLTAGMRLLPPAKLKKLREETCRVLRKYTNFYIGNCEDFVQTIDGETEGLYGWLGLNYLMGQFNGYTDASKIHESIGFMDMGGALTQIAFVPLSEEDITKHDEDLSTVVVRNINGETQLWRVFVETWLGFGANEARRRYLNQLINNNLAAPTALDKTISDPCMPKGTELQYKFDANGKKYKIKGTGSYNQCVKSIYPLLLKNIPCKSEPCLFNGIHGPKLDFNNDKFVGISEYWYTANDIFQLGGEYNFHAFNEKVKKYCESEWSLILENLAKGEYSKLDPDIFLKDACFKASWVMNVLHEGFELPRLGVDEIESSNPQQDKETEEVTKIHVPFKSANSVNGEELSWTLGKMLLFALSQIDPKSENDKHIGIYPSEISGKSFIPGGGSKRVANSGFDSESDDESFGEGSSFFYFPIFLMLFFLIAYFFKKKKTPYSGIEILNLFRRTPIYVKEILYKIPGFSVYTFLRPHSNPDYNLEEGFGILGSNGKYDERNNSTLHHPYPTSVLRTRSSVNLNGTGSNFENQEFPKIANFLNKPFVPTSKASSTMNLQNMNKETSKDIKRASSSNSLRKSAFD